jgi:hypothetical protein
MCVRKTGSETGLFICGPNASHAKRFHKDPKENLRETAVQNTHCH